MSDECWTVLQVIRMNKSWRNVWMKIDNIYFVHSFRLQLIARNSSSPIETFQSYTNYISDTGYSWNSTRVFSDEFTLKVIDFLCNSEEVMQYIVSEQKGQFVVRGPVRILLETSGSRKLYLSSWICLSSLRKGKNIEYTLHYFSLYLFSFRLWKSPFFNMTRRNILRPQFAATLVWDIQQRTET